MNIFAFIQKFKTALPLITALLCLTTLTAFSQNPELIVRQGHSIVVNSVAFSPNGKILASGSWDGTVRLWDVAEGTELRVFHFEQTMVLSVAFSPDGNILACGGVGGVYLWDVATGRRLNNFAGGAFVFSVAFSPDGKLIAIRASTQDANGSATHITLHNVVTGSEVLKISNPSDMGSFVAFGPDGRSLVSGGHGNTVKLWDAASGAEVRTYGRPSEQLAMVQPVSLSPDGKALASADPDGTIHVWATDTGDDVVTFENKALSIGSISFSPDGKSIAIGSEPKKQTSDMTNLTRLVDAKTGIEVRPLEDPRTGSISVAFSPNGHLVASGSRGGEVHIWDTVSGKILHSLVGLMSPVESRIITSDGKGLVTVISEEKASTGSVTRGKSIKTWDLLDNREPRTISIDGNVDAITVSFDGKLAAQSNSDKTVTILDVVSGVKIHTLQLDQQTTSQIIFSPNNQLLATISSPGTQAYMQMGMQPGGVPATFFTKTRVEIWNVATGDKIRTLSEEGFAIGSGTALFSPDSKYCGLMGQSGLPQPGFTQVKVWDIATGKLFRTIGGLSVPINPFLPLTVAFGLNGKSIVISSTVNSAAVSDRAELGKTGGAIFLFDIGSGNLRKRLDIYSTNIEFSPDNKLVAISSETNNSVELWDLIGGVKLRELPEASTRIRSMTFSPNGKFLVTSSGLWDVQSGKKLARLSTLGLSDWLVITQEGLFDGTPNALKQLNWRFDNNTFRNAPVEAFFKEFYYPGLLQEIFAGRTLQQPKTNLSQVDIRQPKVEITIIDGKPAASQKEIPTTNRTVKVTVEITDNKDKARQASVTRSSGAQDVRVFRNGSLVKVWHGDVLKGKDSVTLEATIPVVAGENNLTAYAFNRDNVKSSDARLTVNGADSLKRKGTAFILAVGVNEYSNTQYNLKYAVPDAKDFSDEFKRQQVKLANYEHVEVMASYDKAATKVSILKSLADLSAKIQPEDSLTIFFAGHGTAQSNRFYLIPHDLGYAGSRTNLDRAALQTILSHSISDEEIERAVEGIDAGQMLLVIDACNSGQALEAEEKRRGPMNSKGLAQLAYEKGMYILTAAQSYQAALEAAKLGHGFLTYALVEEGLKTSVADREPKDGQVLLREWLDYATQRVPQMQQDELGLQKKQGRQLNRIKFAAANSGNERSLQRPRVFYRREMEAYPLIVAKP